MKKLFYLLIAFIFSSCIEITQEIQLKKNGSGSAIYTMNMSKMKDMMESLKSFGGSTDDTNISDLDKQFGEYTQYIQSIEGISKVKFSSKNFIYKISFQFKNINALNQALNYLNNGKESLQKPVVEYIKLDNKQVIVRNFNQMGVFPKNKGKLDDTNQNQEEMGDVVLEDNAKKEEDEQTSMIKTFFMDAKYITIVQLYGKVLSNSHPKATVSGKKVTLKLPLLELDKPENAQNIITLK